ncbi:cobalamin-binding protein [Halococcus agarilyticus]|uniref:cobalamin-binding protein n=1 Tax=Halococcus agarilyticus TaxID=1232219 RepID=UPI0006776C6E|nr:cobalamin-binding protein [Halococcus agarilyticus]
MRIVTLLPSATEIVYALGLEPVGTSHECDYPPEAAEKPAVNRSRVDVEASSAEIDSQVLEAEDGDGVYDIDLDTLDRLDPDLVVSQGICDVCAVDSVLVREAVDELDLDCEVLTTDPHSLGDVFADIQRIGDVTGTQKRADELVTDLEARVDAVAATAEEADERPRVAVLDWTDPVMTAGHWVPEMVDLAGGSFGLAEPGDASRPREWDAIREDDPEVLVVAPCGFDLDQTAENLADLTEREGWDDLTAVREGRAYALDGHQFMNRPGPRLVDSLEHLAALVHPELFDAPPDEAARPLRTLRSEPTAEP